MWNEGSLWKEGSLWITVSEDRNGNVTLIETEVLDPLSRKNPYWRGTFIEILNDRSRRFQNFELTYCLHDIQIIYVIYLFIYLLI